MKIDTGKVENVVQIVGDYLKSKFGNHIDQKLVTGTHYDTVHDEIASDIYKSELIKLYPDIQFFSEEAQDSIDTNKPYWMIDPIEGTTNFSHSVPLFATQIAYVENQEVVYGCVYLPVLNELYEAKKGNGAYCNNKKVVTSRVNDLSKAVVCLSKGTGLDNLAWWGNTAKKMSTNVRTIRNLGGAGFEISYVADGKMDVFINHGSHAYDYAAGSIIAKEAGLEVLNFEGKPWSIDDQDIIVCSNNVVNTILKIIQE